jgi:ABC-type branched-subunit amino acid transport system substrate-binding protein
MITVDLPNISPTGTAGTFTKDFNTKFGKDANYPYFAAAAYDAVYLFKNGIASKGYDSTKVKDFLYAIESYNGAAGTYHFDSNGDVVGIALTIKKLENGKFVEIQ